MKIEIDYNEAFGGYLNCIGVGDSYVRMQMERILNNSLMNCSATFRGSVVSFGNEN